MLRPPPTMFGGTLLEPFELVPRDLGGVAALIAAVSRRAAGVSDLTVRRANWSGHSGLLHAVCAVSRAYGLNNSYLTRSGPEKPTWLTTYSFLYGGSVCWPQQNAAFSRYFQSVITQWGQVFNL